MATCMWLDCDERAEKNRRFCTAHPDQPDSSGDDSCKWQDCNRDAEDNRHFCDDHPEPVGPGSSKMIPLLLGMGVNPNSIADFILKILEFWAIAPNMSTFSTNEIAAMKKHLEDPRLNEDALSRIAEVLAGHELEIIKACHEAKVRTIVVEH